MDGVETVRALGVQRDGVAALHEEDVPGGPAAVVAVGDVEAGDGGGDAVLTRCGAGHDLGGDLGQAVGGEHDPVVVTERVGLAQLVGGALVLVHRGG